MYINYYVFISESLMTDCDVRYTISLYPKWSYINLRFNPTRSRKSSMSPSSPWPWLLAPCSTWHAAESGASWGSRYTRWSLSLICPPSSRTTSSWSTEAMSTDSTSWTPSAAACENGAAVHSPIIVSTVITAPFTCTLHTFKRVSSAFQGEEAAACSDASIPDRSCQVDQHSHVFYFAPLEGAID